MKMRMLMLSFCFASWPVLANQPTCVLPPPDGSDVEWTPAGLKGVITRTAKHQVDIRTPDGEIYSLRVSDSTWLSTAYGGGIDFNDLKPGQHALVWLKGCAKPGSSDRAVIIQVCSLAADPCPE